jgi:hypothetical protein
VAEELEEVSPEEVAGVTNLPTKGDLNVDLQPTTTPTLTSPSQKTQVATLQMELDSVEDVAVQVRVVTRTHSTNRRTGVRANPTLEMAGLCTCAT